MKPQFWRSTCFSQSAPDNETLSRWQRFKQRITENRILSHLPKVLSALFALALMSAQAANATNFYVSKSGNNADGLTWQTAWNELAQVNWSKVTSASTIYIDGGPSGMSYYTTLTDDATTGSSASQVQILQSSESGHNGKVTITGGGWGVGVKGYGIWLKGVSNVQVQGNNLVFPGNTGGLEITGEPNSGVYIGNCSSCGLFNVDIHNCSNTGLNLVLGGNTQACSFQNVQIHDNYLNLLGQAGPVNPYVISTFTSCAFYSSSPPSNGHGGTNLSSGHFNFNYCAFGPYGDIALPGGSQGAAPGSNCTASFNQTLFVQPSNYAVYVGGYGNSVSMNEATSFMTALTPGGYARDFLWQPTAGNNNVLSVNNSTVYGGAVAVPTGTVLSSNNSNWQFITTGNTMALGTNIGNPTTQQPLVTNVSGYGNSTPVSTLLATNFSAASTAPTPRYNSSWLFQTINLLLQWGIQTAG